MSGYLSFQAKQGGSVARTVEDAPEPMRQQILGALQDALLNAERHSIGGRLKQPEASDDKFYLSASQTLGVAAAANPPGGREQRISRDLAACPDWRLIFEVVRVWFVRIPNAVRERFRDGVNRVFAAHGVAWDLGGDGELHRVLPEPAAAQVRAMFEELARTELAAERALAEAALSAYDARPRRDRDALVNMSATMEALGKSRLGLRQGTFGDVIATLRARNRLTEPTIRILNSLNKFRNETFGHGNGIVLSPSEVDFAFLACVGGALLLTRMP